MLKKVPRYIFIYIITINLIIGLVMVKKANDYKKNKKTLKIKKYDDKVALVDDINDGINLRLELIKKAEKSLDISYYRIDNSNTSTVFLEELVRAADRGVKVRFITNKFNNSFWAKNSWRKEILASHPNIDFYYYENPRYNLYKLQDINHDKVIIADGDYLLTGGRNIGDRFFIKNDKTVKDLEICVKRKSKSSSIDNYKAYYEKLLGLKTVKKVSPTERSYDSLRNILEETLKDKNFIKDESVLEKIAFRDVKMSFIHNGLGEVVKDPDIGFYLGRLSKSSDSITWISPYLIPTRPVRKLLNLKKDKKNIDFITNSSKTTPNYPGFGASLSYKSRTEKYGHLYSYQGEGSIHTKLVLFDDGISAIGSFNLDSRSTFLSTETMAIVDSDEFQDDLKTYVESLDRKSFYDAEKDKSPIFKKGNLICF
ncbi:phosphatidylserine/phosphatidylglycerophosphate/cardiolipin synthase family protein [uncultured Anaerococcus sp.]|uniref:phospholipase D-like domain-containing protein n=1 Tax=uncultured Anaerococcus sp. TaxID=293428 RepID=UPI0025D5C4DB|nr:phosphatidylserine/phosphatidylglycerophosphate/cardiolipin synthase family protein [uncultured Anaerococcus sp.]